MDLLTSNAVAALSGLTDRTLRQWVTEGLVTPAGRGSVGRGNGSQFTEPQAVAVVYAAALRRAGLSWEYVKAVAAAVAEMDVTELVRVCDGEPALAVYVPGHPVGFGSWAEAKRAFGWKGPCPEEINLTRALDAVMAESLAADLPPRAAGAVRGLLGPPRPAPVADDPMPPGGEGEGEEAPSRNGRAPRLSKAR